MSTREPLSALLFLICSFKILYPINCILLSIDKVIFFPGIGSFISLIISTDLPRLSFLIFLRPTVDCNSEFFIYSIPD